VTEDAYTGRYSKVLDGVMGKPLDLPPDGFVPYKQHMLVELLPPEKISEGGIHIPTQAQLERAVGIIRKLNPEDEGVFFSTGDMVMVRNSAGDEAPMRGENLRVIHWSDDLESGVLGIWPKAVVDKYSEEKKIRIESGEEEAYAAGSLNPAPVEEPERSVIVT